MVITIPGNPKSKDRRNRTDTGGTMTDVDRLVIRELVSQGLCWQTTYAHWKCGWCIKLEPLKLFYQVMAEDLAKLKKKGRKG